MALEARIGDFGTHPSRTPPTRAEREQLLGALTAALALERALSELRPGVPETPRRERTVLAATAAAAALDPDDRLLAPHRLIAAHLARGADPVEVAAARLGLPARRGGPIGFRGAIGPDAVIALSIGRAAALARRRSLGLDEPATVSLVERSWADAPACRRALAMARELSLPLVTVIIDGGPAAPAESAAAIACEDFEAVRAAVDAAIDNASADTAPAVIAVAEQGGRGPRGSLRAVGDDPLAGYRRWLAMRGFSTGELEGIRDRALRSVAAALERLGMPCEEVDRPPEGDPA